ncbi:MAG: toprim domain-containing protein, partial [Rhodocyclales bacterium]|nr:toprim domain-containing protein [Rhodocyclales bacterium]
LGILRKKTGHECYRGMLTIPTFDEDGKIVGLYGRRVTDALAKGELKHLNLPGHLLGLINRAAFASTDEIILCEAPLDALTFWVAGYRNVTCSFGTNGFTDAHREAFSHHRIRRVLIAYDRDEAGEPAAAALAAELLARGIECYRILFPKGMDANDYARKVTPAAKSLGLAIRKAEWLGGGSAPQRGPGAVGAPVPGLPVAAFKNEAAATLAATDGNERAEPSSLAARAPAASNLESPSNDAAESGTPGLVPAIPLPDTSAPTEPISPSALPTPEPRSVAAVTASPVPPAPKPALACRVTNGQVTLARGGRTYTVRGLEKNMSFDLLRVNVTVRASCGLHVDTLDMLSARQRVCFEKAAASELACGEAVVHDDLGALLMALQDLQDDAIKRALAPAPTTPEMTAEARADAMELLHDPRLVERIVADFAVYGIIGEALNTLTGLLASLSRKLEHPLAVIFQSTSSAGKSTVMDGILNFVPPEDRVRYSAMTGQALFYMGETNLAHKVLAVVEEEGAERASYALKILQSDGELTIASTGKDPGSGKHVTHDYKVEGPVMIFLTTTSPDVEEELQNRAIILTANESREQTRAIQQAQRFARTPAGLLQKTKKIDILSRHQNAQRLIRPLAVAYPAAMQLTFPDDKTRTRRDHDKYLTLIETIALLHQYQRPLSTYTENGRTLEYIEITADDIRLANKIAREVLGRSLDELPPQTRALLSHLNRMVTQECERLACERRDYRFTRKQVREFTGSSHTQLRLHLARLEELEYLAIHRGARGLSFVYELLYDGTGETGTPFLPGLLDPDALARPSTTIENLAGGNGYLAGQKSRLAGRWRGQNGPKTPPSRPVANLESPHSEKASGPAPLEEAENASQPREAKIVPYPKARSRSREAMATARAHTAPVNGGASRQKVG